MARGSTQADQAATSANNLSNSYATNANSIYSGLEPELQNMAVHPAGLNPADYAAANTANQQGAGGGQAAAVGQGGLLAARTRNAGGAAAAIGDAARTAGKTLSDANLKTQLENQQLKQGQQREGLSGLEGLDSLNTGASINALGETAANANANTNAYNSSWDWATDVLDPTLKSLSSL